MKGALRQDRVEEVDERPEEAPVGGLPSDSSGVAVGVLTRAGSGVPIGVAIWVVIFFIVTLVFS